MSGVNSDQLHRSTLGVYSSLMDEFNPSLQKLVSLGNSYVQAFKVLAATSEAYFSTLSQIGEKALYTMTSRSLGDALIQISESHRRLTSELEGVFRWFSTDVLQEMDNNIRLDNDYISGSRRYYEMEVHNQRTARERQLRRGTCQDSGEYVQFLRQSHEDALKEEERRYRFLAEKHCGLVQSVAQLMNKAGDSLLQKADIWREDVNATRQVEARRPTGPGNTVGMKEEEFRQSRDELPLGNVPSRAPSPLGSISRSADGGGRSMRALVAHQPSGSSTTLLPFIRGEIITALVQQPRNGWLYGRSDSTACQGWFPASYVEPIDDPPKSTVFRGTNPFATVKLKPTSTNDRSAPRLYRR
ncbi:Brain-specific angiogenesis inhibitor 1-associated protein 2-like protein 2 [Channa argus]|uniref:Brain-specific angiogenesis inhibitor 1-associated protein 2-like protein 2 n=1 Tax=Channa argus TaxID=215402 RepID=A0A6G1QDW6_CHAAH|nr:Brain-specific angiogenesis inhibitor 1-associated protein 2-like protein 2 [Channa argus]